jgi:DNA-directed RNA polymerase specialized sigma subunit
MLLSTLAHKPVPTSQRRSLTLKAKGGDDAAYMALLSDLLPNLRAAIRRFSGPIGDAEEAEAVALVAFTEAIRDYDPARDPQGVGVVSLLSDRVLSALADAAQQSRTSVTVPTRTAQRFWAIMRKAEGDERKAALIAPDYGMAEATFREVYSIVFGTVSLTVVQDYADTLGTLTESAVEDQILAEQALGALDTDELAVTRRAFGFASFRPQSDAEIAGELNTSRSSVQRKRTSAIGTMREALGV